MFDGTNDTDKRLRQTLNPGDFELGSVESRAAARLMAEQKRCQCPPPVVIMENSLFEPPDVAVYGISVNLDCPMHDTQEKCDADKNRIEAEYRAGSN